MKSSSFEKGESSKEIDMNIAGKKRGRPSQQITPEQRKKNKIERDRRDRANHRAEFERLKEVEMKYKLLLEEKEQTKVETGKQKAFLEEIHIDVNQKREQLKVNLEKAQKENRVVEACWNRIANTKPVKELIQQAGSEDYHIISDQTPNREVDRMGKELTYGNDMMNMVCSSDVIIDNELVETFKTPSPPQSLDSIMGYLNEHLPSENMEEGDDDTALKDMQAEAVEPDTASPVTLYRQTCQYPKIGFADHNESLSLLEANNTQCANMSIDALQKWLDGINEATIAGHNVDLVRSRFELAAKTHLEQVEGVLGNMVEQRKAAELADAQNELRQYEEAAMKAREAASLAEKQAEEGRARVGALGGKITRLGTTPSPGPSQN